MLSVLFCAHCVSPVRKQRAPTGTGERPGLLARLRDKFLVDNVSGSASSSSVSIPPVDFGSLASARRTTRREKIGRLIAERRRSPPTTQPDVVLRTDDRPKQGCLRAPGAPVRPGRSMLRFTPNLTGKVPTRAAHRPARDAPLTNNAVFYYNREEETDVFVETRENVQVGRRLRVQTITADDVNLLGEFGSRGRVFTCLILTQWRV